jgi:hypothetical protein
VLLVPALQPTNKAAGLQVMVAPTSTKQSQGDSAAAEQVVTVTISGRPISGMTATLPYYADFSNQRV